MNVQRKVATLPMSVVGQLETIAEGACHFRS